jgi:hypothetical protein
VRIQFPENKTFAFSVVDDTDLATVANVRPVYDLLNELGLRTTKTVWVRKSLNSDPAWASSQTLEDEDYLAFVLELQRRGFEIALHTAAPGTSLRSETISAYQTFKKIFGNYPKINTNHSSNVENIYWGRDRLDAPFLQALYGKLTGWNRFWGHVESSEFFWGDICQKHTKYLRNFTFKSVNTLGVNPGMPYHDRRRPFVNYWFSSSDGADVERFSRLVSERNQERLVREGGCCIVYTHFGKGFVKREKLDATWEGLMRSLAQKNGWFVPASELLDFLQYQKGGGELSRGERWRLLDRWMLEKVWSLTIDKLKDVGLSQTDER